MFSASLLWLILSSSSDWQISHISPEWWCSDIITTDLHSCYRIGLAGTLLKNVSNIFKENICEIFKLKTLNLSQISGVRWPCVCYLLLGRLLTPQLSAILNEISRSGANIRRQTIILSAAAVALYVLWRDIPRQDWGKQSFVRRQDNIITQS